MRPKIVIVLMFKGTHVKFDMQKKRVLANGIRNRAIPEFNQEEYVPFNRRNPESGFKIDND